MKARLRGSLTFCREAPELRRISPFVCSRVRRPCAVLLALSRAALCGGAHASVFCGMNSGQVHVLEGREESKVKRADNGAAKASRTVEWAGSGAGVPVHACSATMLE